MPYLMDRLLNKKIDSIHAAMFESVGFFFIKDLKGRYVSMNRNLLDAAGKRVDEFIGKTDYDAPWEQFAGMFRKHDDIALPGSKPIQVVEVIETVEDRAFLILSEKKAFYHNDKKIGVTGMSLEVPNTLDFICAEFSQESVFYDTRKGLVVHFTDRQKCIAHYLLQGLAAKEIAGRVFLSTRTVEHHINAMKNTNGYHSIKDLLLSIRMV